MTLTTLRWGNATLTFLLELAALAALAYWGTRADNLALKIALGVGLPGLAAVLWGLFAAPHATYSVPFVGLAVKVAVFGSAVIGLYLAGRHPLALTFGAVILANAVLLSAGLDIDADDVEAATNQASISAAA